MGASVARVCLLMGSPALRTTNRIAGLVHQGILEGGALCDFFSLASRPISGCDHCDACMSTGCCIKSDQGEDDMPVLDAMLDHASMLVVVCPVYFAGPPAQLKAVYDRFQPRWVRRYRMGIPALEKRPAALVVVGDGEDPFGYSPLVTITRSALNIAGFRLGEVHDFIGYERGDNPAHGDLDAVRLGQSIAAVAAAAAAVETE